MNVTNKARRSSPVAGALALAILLVFAIPGVYATSIVVIRSDTEVVIGADSKITHPGTPVGPGIVCKIHRANNFVWVSEGHYRDTGAGFNLPILVQSIDTTGDLIDRMKAFEVVVKDPLQRELMDIRRATPVYFNLILQRTHAFEIAFVRVDDVPRWVTNTFHVRLSKSGKIVVTPAVMVCPGKDCQTGMSILMMGGQENMKKWLAEYGKTLHPVIDSVDLARSLINTEIAHDPEHDGPPVQLTLVQIRV